MKLSPWISGRIKPVRVGVYERNAPSLPKPNYSFWNGRFWGAVSPSAEQAVFWRAEESHWQRLKWRGLAAPGATK